ncbi:MAG TPA: hypothetical protein PLY87_27620, partial [Planctomycetaceae bacterium]|nr:hypothetical protein [Planctomycetaceae bacterium]
MRTIATHFRTCHHTLNDLTLCVLEYRLMRRMMFSVVCLATILLSSPVSAQEDFIPRAQDKPPGPALSPAEAIAKMVVPEGFTVELVAAEPDIVNPVAMTIDERGRFWITE